MKKIEKLQATVHDLDEKIKALADKKNEALNSIKQIQILDKAKAYDCIMKQFKSLGIDSVDKVKKLISLIDDNPEIKAFIIDSIE